MPWYKMLAGEYHTLSIGGKLPENSDQLPDGWDEAFVDIGVRCAETGDSGYREIWDVSKVQNEDGTIDFDVGPTGKTVRVPAHATVKVR